MAVSDPMPTESCDEMRFEAPDAEVMMALGAACASAIDTGVVIALDGDLGAGKTVFVRGMAVGFGIDPSLVSSPTFVIMQLYGGGRLDLLHADAYRVRTAAEFEALGWSDATNEPRVVAVIEWASRVESLLPANAILIAFAFGAIDAGDGPNAQPGPAGMASMDGRTVTVIDRDPVRAARMAQAMERACASTVCPTCGKTVSPGSPRTPFCSARCRSADLGRWFDGRYRLSRPLGADDFEDLGGGAGADVR